MSNDVVIEKLGSIKNMVNNSPNSVRVQRVGKSARNFCRPSRSLKGSRTTTMQAKKRIDIANDFARSPRKHVFAHNKIVRFAPRAFFMRSFDRRWLTQLYTYKLVRRPQSASSRSVNISRETQIDRSPLSRCPPYTPSSCLHTKTERPRF